MKEDINLRPEVREASESLEIYMPLSLRPNGNIVRLDLRRLSLEHTAMQAELRRLKEEVTG